MEALNALQETPIPSLLAAAGILLVIWASINIELQVLSIKLPKPSTGAQRTTATVLGTLFLVVGIALFVITPASVDEVPPTETPVPSDTPGATATAAESPTPMPASTAVATATPAAPRPAEIGGNRGAIVGGRAQVWLYEGQQGEVLTIRVNADRPADNFNPAQQNELGLLDTTVALLPPDGTPAAPLNDDIEGDAIRSDSLIENVELPTTGEYQIVVRSYENASNGAYTLILHSDTRPPQGQPDLVVSYIYEPSTTCPTASVDGIRAKRAGFVLAQEASAFILCFTLEVTNIGGRPSGAFAVAIEVADGNGSADPVEVASLEPGASARVNVDVIFYGEGPEELQVIADSGDTVAEMDEANNTRLHEFEVTF